MQTMTSIQRFKTYVGVAYKFYTCQPTCQRFNELFLSLAFETIAANTKTVPHRLSGSNASFRYDVLSMRYYVLHLDNYLNKSTTNNSFEMS